MCGIAGYIGKDLIDEAAVKKTLAVMKNRGPDHQGYAVFNDETCHVALLHSRLGIIDLDERANQPFTIGDLTLIFNGEIYNYLELREHLLKQGCVFITESDTEVLLQAYKIYGENCVNHFEGMWSFAVFDRKTHKLFLSRDRFAEKPLYYYMSPGGLFFGSEVKFIKTLTGHHFTVNENQILRYLVNGYKSLYKSDDTFFKEVKEVPYATCMTVDKDLTPKLRRYWQPFCRTQKMSPDEAVGGFRQRFFESLRIRLRSDVPLAFCLSGGVDSAALVSVAAKIFKYDVATFSIIDRDERYNEYDNIQATVNDVGCRNTIMEIQRESFFPRMELLVAYHDAPVYTLSYYIHSYLSDAISRNGYKVVISGTAADEMVTGYYDHFNLYLFEMRNNPKFCKYLNDWKEGAGRFVRNPYLRDPELYIVRPDFREHIYLNSDIFARLLKKDFKEKFTEIHFCDSMLRNRMLNELFHEAIPVILHEDDLNSMFYSVENRSPYLDSNLFSFSYSIPSEYLIRDGFGKFMLREAVKGILNEQVRTDKCKKGFNASILSLVDLNQKQNRDYLLQDGKIFDYVDRQQIAAVLEKSPMPNSFSKFLFSFISAKIFLEQN